MFLAPASLARSIGLLFLVLLTMNPSAQERSGGNWRKLPLIKEGRPDPSWVHIGYGGWEHDEGALRTKPDAKGLGLLVFSKEKFGDCQIQVVFRTQATNSNSGVYVRIDNGILDQVHRPGAYHEFDASGKPIAVSAERVQASAEKEEGPWYAVHRGFEIQIDSSGGPTDGTGSVYSLAPSSSHHADTRGWSTMLITLDGDRIDVNLNGKKSSSFDSSDKNPLAQKMWYQPKRAPQRPRSGYIGLQTHDPSDIVWFKEISVRPLPVRKGK